MATQPGDHVITLLLLALDKNRSIIDSREVDIPVSIPQPPSLSSDIGIISVILTIITGVIGLWEKYRKKPT